jgi:hypothetical protein
MNYVKRIATNAPTVYCTNDFSNCFELKGRHLSSHELAKFQWIDAISGKTGQKQASEGRHMNPGLSHKTIIFLLARIK